MLPLCVRMLQLLARIFRRTDTSCAPAPPLRHLFAITHLSDHRPRHGYHYRYYCIRCRWLFMVNRHGAVVALDAHSRPLAIAEGALRVRTFAHGPCTGTADAVGLRDAGQPARVTPIRRRRLRPRFRRALH